MSRVNRAPGIVLGLTWVALGLLAIVVGVGVAGIGGIMQQLVDFLPGLAPNRYALTAIAVAMGLCLEVLLVVTGVLVGYIRADRIFHPTALRWVDVLVAAVVVATLLAAVALLFIPGPPQLFILVEACVPVGATIVLVLLVMRSLLRRAVVMHVELDEVI